MNIGGTVVQGYTKVLGNELSQWLTFDRKPQNKSTALKKKNTASYFHG
jgi:hypothetical protein